MPSLMSVFEPVQRIKGPPGTSVQLTLQGTCEQLKVMDGRQVTLQPPLCSDIMPDVPPSPLSADGIRHLNGCPVLSLPTRTETSPRRALRSISPGKFRAITRKCKLDMDLHVVWLTTDLPSPPTSPLSPTGLPTPIAEKIVTQTHASPSVSLSPKSAKRNVQGDGQSKTSLSQETAVGAGHAEKLSLRNHNRSSPTSTTQEVADAVDGSPACENHADGGPPKASTTTPQPLQLSSRPDPLPLLRQNAESMQPSTDEATASPRYQEAESSVLPRIRTDGTQPAVLIPPSQDPVTIFPSKNPDPEETTVEVYLHDTRFPDPEPLAQKSSQLQVEQRLLRVGSFENHESLQSPTPDGEEKARSMWEAVASSSASLALSGSSDLENDCAVSMSSVNSSCIVDLVDMEVWAGRMMETVSALDSDMASIRSCLMQKLGAATESGSLDSMRTLLRQLQADKSRLQGDLEEARVAVGQMGKVREECAALKQELTSSLATRLRLERRVDELESQLQQLLQQDSPAQRSQIRRPYSPAVSEGLNASERTVWGPLEPASAKKHAREVQKLIDTLQVT